jgi:Tol biopolymer transport system component
MFFRESVNDRGVYVSSLDGMQPARILIDDSQAEYLAGAGSSGFLIFRKDNALVAQPFDPVKLQATGAVFPIAEQVSIAGNTPYGAFSAAAGNVAFVSGFRGGNRQMVWLDRASKSLSTIGKPDEISSPTLSPDEETIAFTIGNTTAGSADIWVHDLKRGTTSRFTFGPRVNGYPVWSPDSRGIVYTTAPGGGVYDVNEKPASGTGVPEPILHGISMTTVAYDWSADGKFLVFSERAEKTKDDLWLMPMQGDRKPIPFLNSPATEAQGQFSPDGNWMAYRSDESGRNEIYVQHVPINGMKYHISSTGGTDPRWARNGKELFYLTFDGRMMVVPVKTGATFELGEVRTLFENVPFALSSTALMFTFQPSSDGQRFLALLQTQGEASAPPITVITNWAGAAAK